MNRRYTNGFRKLIAWQEANKLTLKIYSITKKFPKEEIYSLTRQLCKASSSVMANIAEGSAMPTKDHRNSMYYTARGSVVEVDNFIELAFQLHYITEAEYDDILDHAARVSYLITRLIESK